ncbi:MAG: hypothetical protein ABI137_03350 [Antricoccus sp.]
MKVVPSLERTYILSVECAQRPLAVRGQQRFEGYPLARPVVQVIAGISSAARPDNQGTQSTIAIIVVVCFLIGISRAWNLIGRPTVGFTHEALVLLKDKSDSTNPTTVRSAQSTD